MNNMMVREIRGTKINPKSSFKNYGAQNKRGRKLREQIRYIGHVAKHIVQNISALKTRQMESFTISNIGGYIHNRYAV
jgi:hypothetical protein